MVDHHRQIVVPLPIAELVDPDPPQPGQPRRVQPASHQPLDDAADRRPRDAHQATRRRPVRHLRQIRRQLLERRRERAAVRRPRHLLDPNPAASARHSPRRIPQPHRYPTPRQMAPQPSRLPVVAHRPSPAHTAPGPTPRRPRRHAQHPGCADAHLLNVQLRDTQQSA